MGYIARTKFSGYTRDGIRSMFKGGGGKGPSAKEVAEANAAIRQQNVQLAQSTVDKYFSPKTDGDPFSDSWYSAQRKAYSDYYIPELEKQYDNARQQLEMNLAQTNPYGSSTNLSSMSRLEDEYNKQYSSMLQNADNFVADLRQSVADSRTKAMSGAGDVSLSTIAQQAADQAASASTVPAFSPLGQLFANMVTPTVTGLSTAATQAVNTTNSNSGGTTLYSPTKKNGSAVYTVG